MALIETAVVAVGTQSKNLFQVPEGVSGIGAIMVRGAGAEYAEIDFSDASPQQVIPARDIAVDTDILDGDFIPLNKPLDKGTQVHVTVKGTGTAAARVYVRWDRNLSGPEYTWDYVAKDSTALANGDTLFNIPDFVSVLEKVGIRGVDLESMSVKLGAKGQEIDIPCRDIAVNTDAENLGFMVDVGEALPGGGRMVFASVVKGTGGACSLFVAYT